MRVILLANVKNIGQTGETKNVSDGFARNFLLPRKLAEVATEQKVLTIKANLEKRQHEQDDEMKQAVASMEHLSKSKFSIRGKANEEGTLFQGITKQIISDRIKDLTGKSMPTSSIALDKPIKKLGEHKISVNYANQNFHIILNITS